MFAALGKLTSRYPRWVLGGWLLVTLVSLPFGARVGEVLTAQPDAPPGGAAASVRRVLSESFVQAEEEALVAVAYGRGVQAGSAAYDEALDEVTSSLRTLPGVTYVRDYHSATGLVLLDTEANFSVVQIGLDVDGLAEAKAATLKVRAVLDAAPRLRFALSGGPATMLELERVSQSDARRAEVFGLPISLIILLIAVFTQTIVTMLGLAAGIDYALLIVSRFREELRSTFDARLAAERTTRSAGKAVALSGLTVMVALAALLVPPVSFIRSIGVGAMVVLLVSGAPGR